MTQLLEDLARLRDIVSQTQVLALRPSRAAIVLGISTRLLWQLTHDGVIPCVRLGKGKRRAVLYPVAELEAWLRQQAEASKRS